MSSSNKVTCYTDIDTDKCDFTWVIDNVALIWNNGARTILSPVFNVGSDDEKQFKLKLYANTKMVKGVNHAILIIICEKSPHRLSFECKLSVSKDNIIAYNKNSISVISDGFGSELFAIPIEDMNKLISSASTVIFRCELSFSKGAQKDLLSYEFDDANEVPKLKFDSALFNENLSDVKLRTACGKEIPAHRIVLAAASSVFQAMFSHDMLENQSQSVDMIDISYEAAVEMLRYIYTGSVETEELSAIADLLAAADKYQLEGLKHKCEKILVSKLTAGNCVEILIIADKYSASSLKKKVIDFIKLRINVHLDSDDIGDMILNGSVSIKMT
ncbi:speckle-type POZ protein B-like [Trichogramma pretiosum]|uniref:speckle-type POZ protein B-like n=1 Tax=Trichogramma pretiosum TaxID=7493 RepID=UPI000C71C40C|nr:speckle-type POZ protein B-like [Trichogramma pretiosum]